MNQKDSCFRSCHTLSPINYSHKFVPATVFCALAALLHAGSSHLALSPISSSISAYISSPIYFPISSQTSSPISSLISAPTPVPVLAYNPASAPTLCSHSRHCHRPGHRPSSCSGSLPLYLNYPRTTLTRGCRLPRISSWEPVCSPAAGSCGGLLLKPGDGQLRQ